jgi:mannose-1-phosphate guanylyltransferase/mannose-6-phosphate isomerase
LIEHVERPWGWYETVSETAGSKVKRIHVHPGHKLSLQKHQRRGEHWVVVLGVARVTIGQREFDVTVGGHCDIEQMQVHRLRNCTDGPLEIIEVQIGEYLGEDDIVRLEDGYGRT